MSTHQNRHCQCLCPQSHPPAFAGDLLILAGRPGPVFYKGTVFFSWVLVCVRTYVFPLSGMCFPQSCGYSVIKPPVARPSGWEA